MACDAILRDKEMDSAVHLCVGFKKHGAWLHSKTFDEIRFKYNLGSQLFPSIKWNNRKPKRQGISECCHDFRCCCKFYFDKLSFLDQKYNMPILSTCIYHVWCPVLRAELLSMPRLVKLKTHLHFSASHLKLVHTSTLCCHIQMILVHFQLKGNARGVNTYLRVCVLRVCSCDSQTVIHIIVKCVESLIHIHFKPPIRQQM